MPEKDSNNKYENMCFVMMPISDKEGYDKGHFTKIYEQIFKPAIKDAGYEPYRVDENKISDSIIVKIFEAIQNAPMALCDLSSNNPNVLYELGLRQAYDKPVILVKDSITNHIFDIGGISTIQYEKLRLYENVEKAKEDITQAIISMKNNESKYSLVNMVKASKAIIDHNDMGETDAMHIMLRQILNEIKEINNNEEIISNRDNKSIRTGMRLVITDIEPDERQDIIETLQQYNHVFDINIYYETSDEMTIDITNYNKENKSFFDRLVQGLRAKNYNIHTTHLFPVRSFDI